MRSTWAKNWERKVNGYLFAIGGIVLVTALLAPSQNELSSTTVALAFLLIVLFSATGWGIRPAMAASLLAVLSFNFFFLPPLFTWTIADPQNWVALAAFLITALTAGSLSARAKRRAEEAEERRRQIEGLYRGYQAAVARANQAEVIEQSEKLKSALLDAVTHDLRTPLTSIKAAVTTLLSEVVGDEPVVLDSEARHEFLQVIDEETDRLNRFVESLVELASIEAGAIRLRRRWIPVEEIINMARERARLLTRDHLLQVEIEDELPVALVDAALIAEVLYSLIDNATKYSPAGTPIRISVERAPNEMIEFGIEDEGRGIPPELRERVFDKFFRATDEGAASLGRPKGLGMGLAIARGIVEAHGGSIRVENGKNEKGVRVAFIVPIGDDEPAQAESEGRKFSGGLTGKRNWEE
ncbi:MAG: PAS domain-containing sensor histidine kinase [Blastocatellia bacterium]|nr:PAS domain-containing sensor histidine kinase [Blastocatellia bacterium]